MTPPKTMHAVLLKGHGGFEQLTYRDDVATPEPDAGEVLIRVGAAAINNTDINTRTAWYARRVQESDTADNTGAGITAARAEDGGWSRTGLTFPRIQGADVCGSIVAVGEGVDEARVGERVLVDPVLRESVDFRAYEMAYFGSECDGGFAQYAKVWARNAHKVESVLGDAEMASFPCSYSTAENMLTRAAVVAGETVLVTGASGGVGSALVQLAVRRRARVLALAGAAKRQQVASLGAERVIDRGADLVTSLGHESADVVADVVGGPQFGQLLDVLKRGGRYVCSGAVAGPVVSLDLRTFYLKDLKLFGATVSEPELFADLIGYIERGEIKPLVARTYPLRDIVQAQKDFLAKRHIGKLVLIPPD